MMVHKKRFPTEKDMGGCAISGIMSEAGERFSGDVVIKSIAVMHDRSNGLGGGFAAYGIYPDYKDYYAIHIMYDSLDDRQNAEQVIHNWTRIYEDESIPNRPSPVIRMRPLLHRYFVQVRDEVRERFCEQTDDDLIVDMVMEINAKIKGAFVFSSGKNMGVFKGVGYPEDIGEFYRLDEYKGYIWTSHGRFPTNTSGWWGGAHPFSLLDWSVVHNGEISSYGINKRYLDNFGYLCSLYTDTEVIAYLFDLLVRKHGLPFEAACMAMAPPFWSQIQHMPPERAELARTLRIIYSGALLNGPFSVLVGHRAGMVGFNDRTKLRPMVAARKDDFVYAASEEAAIREVCSKPDKIWHAVGGLPIIGQLKDPVAILGEEEAVRFQRMACTLTGGAAQVGGAAQAV
jgi:glutamate synthase domain-containing protein 1